MAFPPRGTPGGGEAPGTAAHPLGLGLRVRACAGAADGALRGPRASRQHGDRGACGEGPSGLRCQRGHAGDQPPRRARHAADRAVRAGYASAPAAPAVAMSAGPAGESRRGRGWYWQRWYGGEPVSALVVANGENARVVAVGQQLVAPGRGRPFRFGGVLTPADISAVARHALEHAALRLAVHYRLRGLASVDALVAGDAITVLELNPRPGGSLDAHAAALGANLFALHVAACRAGSLPEPMMADALRGVADRPRRPCDSRAGRVRMAGLDGGPLTAGNDCSRPAGRSAPFSGMAPRRNQRCDCCRARADRVRAALRMGVPACGKLPLRYDRQVMISSHAAQ